MGPKSDFEYYGEVHKYHMRAMITHGLFTQFLKSISLFSRRCFQRILSLCMVSIQEQFLIKMAVVR